jgi:hypothetical protein
MNDTAKYRLKTKYTSLQISEVKQMEDEMNTRQKIFTFRVYIRQSLLSLNCETVASSFVPMVKVSEKSIPGGLAASYRQTNRHGKAKTCFHSFSKSA